MVRLRYILVILTSIFLLACDDIGILTGHLSGDNEGHTQGDWNFSTAADYTYNDKYIQVTAGKAQLKQVDQTYNSQVDFDKGTYSSTVFENEALTIDKSDRNYEHDVSWTPQFTSIIGYWKMNNNWNDSADSNHGVIVDSPSFSTNSQIGSHSGDFDGDAGTDRVDVLHFSELENLPALSISVWVNFHDLAVDATNDAALTDALITKGGRPLGTAGEQEWYIYWDSRQIFNCLKFVVVDNTAASSVAQTCNFADNHKENVWYHVVATWTPARQRVYIDGVMLNENSSPMASVATVLTEDLRFGSGDVSYYLDG